MGKGDEERLVDAVLAGDQDSRAHLRSEYLGLARSLARWLDGNEGAAERALDVFIQRLSGWPRQYKLSTYATWVMRQAIDPERYGPPDAGPHPSP